MTKELGITAHPLDFNPPPTTQFIRAVSRHERLLEAQAAGQDVDAGELERYRETAYGKVDNE